MSTAITQPESTTWQIDPAHTQVEFEVKHMMFAKVRGRFTALEGTLALDAGGNLEDAEVAVVIDAASIDTGQPARDDHLRSADFFDTEQFPTLSFRSSRVRRGPEGALHVTGDLTIRDITREVELEVAETGDGIDPWGNQRAGYNATTTIDRRDFGLTWNQALETGGILVGNEVKIVLEVQVIGQAD